MEKLKESLELLREIELCETKYNTCSNLDSKKRYELCLKLALMFQKRCITYIEVPEYKEAIKTKFLMPNEKEQASSLYQNVVTAYHHWFSNGVEFNEYFKDAWMKIFRYMNLKDDKTTHSVTMLQTIYNQISYLLEKILYLEEKKTGEIISCSESEFLGNFFTCFPNNNEKSVIGLAENYMKEMTLFLATMCPRELVDLSLLDKIELGYVWSKKNESQILKKERVD